MSVDKYNESHRPKCPVVSGTHATTTIRKKAWKSSQSFFKTHKKLIYSITSDNNINKNKYLLHPKDKREERQVAIVFCWVGNEIA